MELVLSLFVVVVLPLALLFGLGMHAGILFFAASSGLLLLDSLDPVAVSAAGSVVPGEGGAYVRLAVVLGSMIVAGGMYRRVRSLSTKLVHTLLVLVLGAVLALELPSASGVSWLVGASRHEYWDLVHSFKTLLIGAGLLLSLVTLLLSSSSSSGRSKRKKKSH